MKNKVKAIGKILGILATALMLASFSPSLDGRAVVVDRGVFPQGLFAKTVGYLPGDIISVANITGDSTVDLLVIGALDPSDGIAIMLSPEAADAVGISKDDNIVVKITKRNGQNERVYGTAVIAKQNPASEASALELDIAEEDFDESDDDTSPAPAVEDANEIFDDDEPYEEISAAQEEPEPEPEIEEFEEDDFDAATADEYEPSADAFEEFYEEEVPSDNAFDEDDKIEKVVVVVVDEITALPGQTATERVEADEFEDFDEEDVAEELVSDDETETPVEEEADASNEPKEMVIIIEESLPPAPEDTAADEGDDWESVIPEEVWAEEESAGESVADITEEIPAEEPYDEDAIEEIAESTATYEEESIEDEIDEVYEVIEETDYDDYEDEDYDYDDYEDEEEEYDAIVLVPVAPEPPAPVVRPEPEQDARPSAPVPPAPAADESESHEMTDSGYSKYLVNSLDDLQSGAYYIQIATLTVDEHIMNIVTKYSANYPITIVPLASGARKQVLIGPLSMDEYAVVLERFKSYGYKDAFLRKIK